MPCASVRGAAERGHQQGSWFVQHNRERGSGPERRGRRFAHAASRASVKVTRKGLVYVLAFGVSRASEEIQHGALRTLNVNNPFPVTATPPAPPPSAPGR